VHDQIHQGRFKHRGCAIPRSGGHARRSQEILGRLPGRDGPFGAQFQTLVEGERQAAGTGAILGAPQVAAICGASASDGTRSYMAQWASWSSGRARIAKRGSNLIHHKSV
jgi:hypothetical protein